MKKLTIIVLAIMFATTAFAQDLKIKILSNGEQLPYSYVYLHGEVVLADSMGLATLPMSKIHLGDSLSASFVGYGRNAIVVNEEIMQKAECTINLDTNLTLDEVVIKADVAKLYQKFTKIAAFYHYGNNFDINYKYEIKKNGDVIKDGSGDLSLVYLYRYLGGDWRNILPAYGYPDSNVKEDTSFANQLIASVHQAVSFQTQSYNYIFKNQGDDEKTINYLGLIGNNRVFTAVTKSDTKTTQIICHFDKDTKYLSHYELSVLEYDTDGNLVIRRDSKFDLELLKLRKMAMRKEHVITKVKEITKYKDYELITSLDINPEFWKHDKSIKWDVVSDIKILLDSDFSDKKY